MARMTNEDEDEDRRALWHGRWPRPSLSRSKPEDRTEALQPRVKAERRHTYTPTRRHEPCRSASATPCRGAHRTLHTAPRSTSTAQRWDDAMTSRSGWRATYTYIALGGRLGGKECHWGNGRGLLDYRIGFDIGIWMWAIVWMGTGMTRRRPGRAHHPTSQDSELSTVHAWTWARARGTRHAVLSLQLLCYAPRVRCTGVRFSAFKVCAFGARTRTHMRIG